VKSTTIPDELKELSVYASCMEAYGLKLRDVMEEFNYGQIVMLSKISECRADDMDRELKTPQGQKLNKTNKEAADLLRKGI